jgi:hypothetical protein
MHCVAIITQQCAMKILLFFFQNVNFFFSSFNVILYGDIIEIENKNKNIYLIFLIVFLYN